MNESTLRLGIARILLLCCACGQAVEALHRQIDRNAIAEGLAQMEAGEGVQVAAKATTCRRK